MSPRPTRGAPALMDGRAGRACGVSGRPRPGWACWVWRRCSSWRWPPRRRGEPDDGSVHEPAIGPGRPRRAGGHRVRRLVCPGEPFALGDGGVAGQGDGRSPSAARNRFADVDSGVWWAPYVERLADTGVCFGAGPVLSGRAGPGADGDLPDAGVRSGAGAGGGFLGHRWPCARGGIDALAGSGHGGSSEPARFCPGEPVTRGDGGPGPRTRPATCGVRASGPGAVHGLVRPASGRGGPAPGRAGRSIQDHRHRSDLRDTHPVVSTSNRSGAARGEFTSMSVGSSTRARYRRVHGTGTGPGAGGPLRSPAPRRRSYRRDPTAGASPDGAPGTVHERHHSCGIRDAAVACWGEIDPTLASGYQRLRHDPTALGLLPARIRPGSSPPSHPEEACGLRTDGALACWGASVYDWTRPPAGSPPSMPGRRPSRAGGTTRGGPGGPFPRRAASRISTPVHPARWRSRDHRAGGQSPGDRCWIRRPADSPVAAGR